MEFLKNIWCILYYKYLYRFINLYNSKIHILGITNCSKVFAATAILLNCVLFLANLIFLISSSLALLNLSITSLNILFLVDLHSTTAFRFAESDLLITCLSHWILSAFLKLIRCPWNFCHLLDLFVSSSTPVASQFVIYWPTDDFEYFIL